MKVKLFLAAAALAVVPSLAAAMCSDRMPTHASGLCAEGQVWDAATRTCVPATVG